MESTRCVIMSVCIVLWGTCGVTTQVRQRGTGTGAAAAAVREARPALKHWVPPCLLLANRYWLHRTRDLVKVVSRGLWANVQFRNTVCNMYYYYSNCRNFIEDHKDLYLVRT